MDVKRTVRSIGTVWVVLLLLTGVLVGPASAQDGGSEDDGYPPEVEGEVIVDDDVVVDDPEAGGTIVPDDDTDVLGRVLARTGGDLGSLIVLGVVLLGLGSLGVSLVRRRRSAVAGG